MTQQRRPTGGRGRDHRLPVRAGEFGNPFGVSLDPGQLAEVFAANKIDAGAGLADNALTLRVLELVPQAWGFYWANPSRPGFVDQAADWLCGPRAKGVRLLPLSTPSTLPAGPWTR